LRIALRALPLVLAVLGASCHAEAPARVREPPEPPSSEDSIPVAPLAGKLLGRPFTFQSGRYTIDQRPGYEKIDIKLYPVSADPPCGDLAGKPPSVWLRRRGPKRVEPGVSPIHVKTPGEWEAHYQLFHDDEWIGNGEANALLAIDEVGPDMKIDGELSACFRDTEGSCVRGRFSAVYCRIGIDSPVRGTDAMERPPSKPMSSAAESAAPGVLAPVPLASGAPAGSEPPP
jgi:hypothetical protein